MRSHSLAEGNVKPMLWKIVLLWVGVALVLPWIAAAIAYGAIWYARLVVNAVFG